MRPKTCPKSTRRRLQAFLGERLELFKCPASTCVVDALWHGPSPERPRRSGNLIEGENYLISTLAPASSNFFLIAAASSLLTPSLTVLGAPSTRSLASFKPRLVTSRTALMTLILLPPTSVSTTVNSVFSSTGAAPPAAAPPPAATTVAAAAETPKASSIFLTRSEASSNVSPLISSRIVSTFAMTISSPLKISKPKTELTGPLQEQVLLRPRRTQTCWP